MIVFNALRILPELLFTKNPYLYLAGQSILEISGGLLCIKTFVKSTVLTIVLAHTWLAFGGLSLGQFMVNIYTGEGCRLFCVLLV